jgi:ribosomal-protein-alanine N-acetyltransferase
MVRTANLILRDFEQGDLEPLYAIQSDAEAMRYTWIAPSREASAQRLQAYAAQKALLGYAAWTVVLAADNRVIGWGGLNIDPFDPGWGPEVAYFFHPAHWGKGYATELVRAALEDGFAAHSLEEIKAFAHPENLASIRVLTKCDFRQTDFVAHMNRNLYRITSGEYGSERP